MSIKNEFVKKFYQDAVNASRGSKILPDTIIASAALESNFNRSLLSKKYNNFFGRKPDKNWKGKVVILTTDEYINNRWESKKQPFKWYDTPEQSFRDYVKLLSFTKRYQKVLLATTPVEQFKEIQKAGYATDPSYSIKLNKLLEELKPMIPVGVGLIFLVAFLYLIFGSRTI